MIVCSHYLILKGSKALSQLLSPSEKPAGDNKRPTSYTQNRGVGTHGGKWPSSILLYQVQREQTYQIWFFYDWPPQKLLTFRRPCSTQLHTLTETVEAAYGAVVFALCQQYRVSCHKKRHYWNSELTSCLLA